MGSTKSLAVSTTRFGWSFTFCGAEEFCGHCTYVGMTARGPRRYLGHRLADPGAVAGSVAVVSAGVVPEGGSPGDGTPRADAPGAVRGGEIGPVGSGGPVPGPEDMAIVHPPSELMSPTYDYWEYRPVRNAWARLHVEPRREYYGWSG